MRPYGAGRTGLARAFTRAGATVRFQAGDYQQANTSHGPQDGARVSFHHLSEQ